MSTTGSDHPRVATNDADGTHKTYVTLDVFSQLMPWINSAASGESRHWKAGSRHVMQERAKLYKNDISPRSCDATLWRCHQSTKSHLHWKCNGCKREFLSRGALLRHIDFVEQTLYNEELILRLNFPREMHDVESDGTSM